MPILLYFFKMLIDFKDSVKQDSVKQEMQGITSP